MPLRTILFLLGFVGAAGGALFIPIMGVLGYVALYSIGAERQRWFAPIRGLDLRCSLILAVATGIGMALLMAREIVRNKRPVIPELPEGPLDGKRLILVTGHRRESFGKPFEELCLGLRDVVRAHPDTVLVYPVHLNPNIRKPVFQILGSEDRVHLIRPIEYLPFVSLMERSYLIVTDSGGIQEEAPSLHKPVLVTREVTERPEAVQSGLARLVGTSRQRILAETSRLLTDAQDYAAMSRGENPYGDGQAAQRIVDALCSTMPSPSDERG
jgi:UDP-N-acetylglucosamine 2-epimerase